MVTINDLHVKYNLHVKFTWLHFHTVSPRCCAPVRLTAFCFAFCPPLFAIWFKFAILSLFLRLLCAALASPTFPNSRLSTLPPFSLCIWHRLLAAYTAAVLKYCSILRFMRWPGNAPTPKSARAHTLTTTVAVRVRVAILSFIKIYYCFTLITI